MQQNIQSINQLVRDLLIPIIGSIFAHVIIFVILSNLIYYWSLPTSSNNTRPISLTVKLANNFDQTFNFIPLRNLSKKSANKKFSDEFVFSRNEKPRSLFEGLPSRYYTVKELDRAPTTLKKVDSTSLESLRFAEGGELALRFWIDEEGNVINTEIAQSNLPDEFNQKAMALFSDVKFSPGVRNDQPVKTILKIVIRYAAEEK